MCDNKRFHNCGKHFGENGPRCEGGEMRGPLGDPRERFMEFYREASTGAKLMINFRYVSRTMRSQFEQKAGQKRILFLLNEQGTLTQRELTEQLGVRPGSASEILSKLENAGLIARTQNESDRRTVDVSLTEAGAAAAAESAETRGRHSEEMFACLTGEEQLALLSLLEKIHADWESRYPGRRGPHGHHGHHGPHGDCGCGGPHGPRGPHSGCRGPHGPHGEFGPCDKPQDGRPDED